MGTEVGGACLQVAPPAGGLQQDQLEWDGVVTKAPWQCEPQVLNRERSRCAPILNASLASSRRPVRSSCSTDTLFRHLRSDSVLVRPPLGVSKRSVVELCGKDQQIALAEYSRLVVSVLVLDQYLVQLWQVRIFRNYMFFQLFEFISATLSIVAA